VLPIGTFFLVVEVLEECWRRNGGVFFVWLELLLVELWSSAEATRELEGLENKLPRPGCWDEGQQHNGK